MARRDGTDGNHVVAQTVPLAPVTINGWHSSAFLEELANGPYLYGGQAVSATWVTQNSTYPHLFVADRTNVHTYAQDDWVYGQDGYATAESRVDFYCEEYSYLQFSKHYYGYLDVLGIASGGNTCERDIRINNILAWSSYPSVPGASIFVHDIAQSRHLLLPGHHMVVSSHRLISNGIPTPVPFTPGRNWHSHETYQNVANFTLPESSWWVFPAPNETVWPSSFTLTSATQTGGSLASVQNSDDSRLQIRLAFSGKSPSSSIIFRRSLPFLASVLRIYIESQASPRHSLRQKVALWNIHTNSWDLFDTRNPTEADSVAYVRTVDTWKYVHSSTNEVQIRITWEPSRSAYKGQFDCAVDEVKFIAFRLL
ncbi:MAG: hypothetical protein K1X67_02330 [Fimbriimonadaceae bacterium]|nr:hypothetical protein [Fimbriimonadaceae bacterium]